MTWYCTASFFCSHSKQALKDAEKTVELKKDWAKGYSRKGAALYGLQKYDDAISVYEAGLALDPENALLKKGLEETREAKDMPTSNPFARLFGPDVFEKIAGIYFADIFSNTTIKKQQPRQSLTCSRTQKSCQRSK